MREPSIRQRRLGSELRRLRKEAGLTGKEAAAILDLDESMMSRIESGQRSMRPPDLNALLDGYGLTDKARRQGLIRLARDAKRRSWFNEYEDILGEGFRDYLGLETEATSIRVYHPQCVPGLLQIEAYSRALDLYSVHDKGAVERMLKVRKTRQAILEREEPPTLTVILDEPIIRRPIGGRDVLGRQLQHLVAMARRPNIRIQILSYDIQHGVVITGGAFIILGFPEEGVDAAFLENLQGGDYLDTDSTIRTYDVTFDQLQAAAFPPDRSIELITAAAEELASDG